MQGVTKRETQHVEAALRLAEGSMYSACTMWENILKEHPTDMLAIKAAHDCYFYLGKQKEMRVSIENVMPKWKADLPLYSYLYGMYAFGLCETGSYVKASKVALRGLELNRNDAWATHANAHVFEMTSQPSQGISFMSRTIADWQPCGLLSCHNFWHWAVYHIEKGESDGALDLFDSEVEKRCGSGSMLDYVDGASLLYRLELEGVDVGHRWSSLYSVTKEHLYDHILLFNDAHFAMTLLGLKDKEYFAKFQDSLNSIQDLTEIDNTKITTMFGKKLIQAMKDYSEGDFDACASALIPLEPQLVQMGGSDAQRDVFNLLMINAALRSSRCKEDAKKLLYRRSAVRRASPMVDRMRKLFVR
ncbi:tetratricopeptide repeat protein 38-like [Tropilaelaps mercedesae]|uniref:Tetratricopeptide repeat protein 38 n=1 Tax=Tropilaelaps mercedesae TaxID=418985 RepID=A0A1V9XWI8_9ACAR|nr:tetratricopeptide repeat protein 38-like [Tropilaelaps mercedesae]